MARRIDISLEGLHHLLHRIERKELVDGDWAICGALVLQLIAKIQGQQERMAAKLARGGSTASTTIIDASPGSPALPASSSEVVATASTEQDGPSEPTKPETKKAKGHGRNGASAFVNAKHVAHGLAAGVRGSRCACGVGHLTRY